MKMDTTMDIDDDKQPLLESEEADNTQHQESTFKRQACADLSRWEWLFIILSCLDVVYATVLSVRTFTEQKSTSAQFTFAVVVFIAAVFLLVYTAHGVFWRVPYSVLLHCLLHLVLVAGCIVYLVKSKNEELIIIVFCGLLNAFLELWLVLYFAMKYCQARTMRFPYGTDTYNQDEIVRHLLAMSLLLLNLQLELTLVVFVLKIDKTELDILEYFKLVGGCIYSFSMCFCGFMFVCKKWKPLVFVIPLASLIEVAYIIYNLLNTGQTWQAFLMISLRSSLLSASLVLQCEALYAFFWAIYMHIQTIFDYSGYVNFLGMIHLTCFVLILVTCLKCL